MNTNQDITRIVITGGPCAGKTTCMSTIVEWLTKQGYFPLVIDEVSTRLQNSGIRPISGYLSINEFEKALLQTQINDEEIFGSVGREIARTSGKKPVIIQDRGILDIAAYIGIKELQALLKEKGRLLNTELQKYDAFIHLVTAANGAVHAYTTENNNARTETVEQARNIDDKIYHAYVTNSDKPLFRIGNNGNFENKKLSTLNAINSVLGLPLISEIQKKFLVSLNGMKQIISQYGGTKLFIQQTYLDGTSSNYEQRLRFTSYQGSKLYALSETKHLKNGERVKTERMLDENEYISLKSHSSFNYKTIEKVRWCINTNNLYLELDHFINPFIPYAIMEIKALGNQALPDISFLPGIIKELTSHPLFLNKEIAKKRYCL